MVQVDERKNQFVRSTVSLAIIQLLLKLPQQLFDMFEKVVVFKDIALLSAGYPLIILPLITIP